jgi:hypothetical protein
MAGLEATNFHTPSSNSKLVIEVTPEAKIFSMDSRPEIMKLLSMQFSQSFC